MDFITEALKECVEKTGRNLDALEKSWPRFPHVVRNGEWATSGEDSWKNLVNGYWTGGFWVGILLMAHEESGDDRFSDAAWEWMRSLEERASFKGIHDLGFLFYPSAVLGFEMTGDAWFSHVAMRAARSMLSCWRPESRCLTILQDAEHENVLAVDTMMNLPLLWWAAGREGGEGCMEAAMEHSRTTARLLVRPDGSTVHIARLKPGTDEVERYESWQGASPEGCWSRGHAWATAGFAQAWSATGDEGFRKTFDRLLAFADERLPEDHVPYWDYDAEGERDASAAAAMAWGLLVASRLDPVYATRGIKTLRSLSDNYRTAADAPGFLRGVCFHRPAGEDVDVSAIFADYFYFHALRLAQKVPI